MTRKKIVTIVGTRPEIIRLSRAIPSLDDCFDHTLIHTGQNYDFELNQIFFDELELRQPDMQLTTNDHGNGVAETIGNIIKGTYLALAKIKPAAVLLLGDTNSCLSAISAQKLNIPIFHVEAGNRCFDLRVPEESNRRLVDHISDVNITYSNNAKQNLLNEGLPPDRCLHLGSPMFEVISHYFDRARKSKILNELELEKGKYFLVSMHREENTNTKSDIENLANILNLLANKFGCPVILSAHPRTRKKLKEFPQKLSSNIRALKPFGFLDYLWLQANARIVLSDSGTITEESSILGFKAINLRETHERPEGMEEAVVMLAGTDPDRVFQTIEVLESQVTYGGYHVNPVPDYRVENFSKKLVRIIQSYTEYILSKTYHK